MIPEPKTKEAAEKYIAELRNHEEHHITKDFRVKLLDLDCLPCRRIWQKSKDAGVSEEYMGRLLKK